MAQRYTKMSKDKLIQERDDILRWMDANDGHFSTFFVNKLNEICEEINKLNTTTIG